MIYIAHSEKRGPTWSSRAPSRPDEGASCMPIMAIVQLTAVLAIGAGGAILGVPRIRPAASDAIAVCAVLAAFLVQVMLLLATVLDPGKLSPEFLRQIVTELDRMQSEAFSLFCFYVAALTAFLCVKLTNTWVPRNLFSSVQSHGLAFVSCSVLAFAVIRTVAFLSTMRDVQALRHRLLLQDAQVEALKAGPQVVAELDRHAPEPDSPPFGQPATGYE